MKQYFFITISFLFLLSCEKEITIDLPKVDSKIVVEGYIEQGQLPYVFLSRSSSYFDPIDSASLVNSFVKGATVIIQEGNNIDTLIEVGKAFGYDIGYLYMSFTMIGEVGKTYNLTVIADGQTLTATTTIPQVVPLDSAWFERQNNEDSTGLMHFTVSDPPNEANYYRLLNKVLGDNNSGSIFSYLLQGETSGIDSLFSLFGGGFLPPMPSVYNDIFFDGLSFEFEYQKGLRTSAYNEDDFKMEDMYFKIGDTIVAKSCSIDREAYEFWESVMMQSSSGGPFSIASSVKTNINGGYGIWAGYAATYDTVIAK